MLADEGIYLASESTFSRVLREHGQTAHRGRAKAPTADAAAHHAHRHRTAPGVVLGHDLSAGAGAGPLVLPVPDPGPVQPQDRRLGGARPPTTADHAAHLVRRTALAEGIAALGTKPVLHGDNGSTLKATTVLAMLNWLGVKPSYSRPRVSDDNAYAESLFRTAKYRPEFPTKGFADLDQARTWAAGFVHWYNVDHRHSGIRYVSPAQRHAGDDHAILAARHALYLKARERNPARWSGHTRNWTPIGAVTLNPERDSVVRHVTSNE